RRGDRACAARRGADGSVPSGRDGVAAVTTHQRRRELLERMLSEQPQRLVRKMRAAGHTGPEAEDLAQETVLRALRSLDGVRAPDDEALICGWVDRIATNLSKDTRRGLARRPHDDPVDDVPESAPALVESDDADLVACRQSLDALLGGLPDEQRAVFVARVLEERTTAQVAADLGISE